MKINQIQEELEKSKGFQYWNKAIGLTFDDFNIVNLDTSTMIKTGKKNIGSYCIYLEDNKIKSACYDMDNETVRQCHNKEVA